MTRKGGAREVIAWQTERRAMLSAVTIELPHRIVVRVNGIGDAA